MFVSDQLIDAVISDIKCEMTDPKRPIDAERNIRKFVRRFKKLMDSWFDGTTGPEDIEEAKTLIKRLGKLRDTASPENAGAWDQLQLSVKMSAGIK